MSGLVQSGWAIPRQSHGRHYPTPAPQFHEDGAATATMRSVASSSSSEIGVIQAQHARLQPGPHLLINFNRITQFERCKLCFSANSRMMRTYRSPRELASCRRQSR